MNQRQFFHNIICRIFFNNNSLSLVLALAVSSLLFVMSPRITQGVDYYVLHHFYKFYLHASIRSGELPLWNPYTALGRPFLADPEAAVFYPPNWLFIPLPETPALFIFLAFHFWLAGFFFLKLGQHWGAPRDISVALAVAYMLSGPFLGHLQGGMLGYFCGLAYWPLVFYLIEELRVKITVRNWMALVLAAAGSFLSGHPQCFWLTAVAASLYLLGAHLGSPWRKHVRRAAACLGVLVSAYVFALMLCAIQLLPTLDLVAQANRSDSSLQFAEYISTGWSWISSLYISRPTGEAYWDSNIYIGIISTLIGFMGLMQWRDMRIRGLYLMGLFGYFLSLGNQTPFFAAMFHLLPGMGLFRVAARYAILMPWSVLLGGLLGGTNKNISSVRIALVACFLLGGVIYLVPEGNDRMAGITCAVILTVLALAALHFKRKIWLEYRYLLLMVLCLDSLVAALWAWKSYGHWGPQPHFEREISDAARKKGLYASNGVPPRFFMPSYLIRANGGIEYGYSSVSGYGALTLMRVWTYLHAGLGLPLEAFQDTYLPDAAYAAGPFPFPKMDIAAGVIGARDYHPTVLFNPRREGRAYLVYDWRQLPDWTAALRVLVRGQADLAEQALLEGPDNGSVPNGKGRGEAVIDAFRLNSMVLHVRSSEPALLIIAEAWYPGWRATINGVPAKVFPANVWMRALRVPAGNSQIKLYYVEQDLRYGAMVTLFAILCFLYIGYRVTKYGLLIN